ncbi:unnamed protein product [Cyprideis torosa]|uniref:Uncharacterized protein n=1 Tax=Cyprideis torosa TaxID=163714 RepID=A0A7R8ZIA1_9CRUS|nr:unnamed protein product [Cyprideis torosa]CAG0879521.1 unnamed protein product [Cyprideis torosa]
MKIKDASHSASNVMTIAYENKVELEAKEYLKRFMAPSKEVKGGKGCQTKGSQKNSPRSLYQTITIMHFSPVVFCPGTRKVLPLSAVRVLDLTRILAGPYCTMQLGDLGADVIKIEEPEKGDETRRWGPPFLGNESCYFLSVNRNKRSMTLNLKTREAQGILKRLVAVSDVLIQNYLPDRLPRLGLTYEEIQKCNPKIIYCSLSGFGSTGPYRKRAGYDVIAASVGGFLDITGPQDGEPCKAGTAVTDLITGLQAKSAILAALIEREKTGKGQKIETNLLACQVSMLVNIASAYLNGGAEYSRFGTSHASIVPYQAFQTADGFITIGATTDQQFINFSLAIDEPGLLESPKYKTNKLRVQHREELLTTIKNKMVVKTSAEWEAKFEKENSEFAYGRVNRLGEVFEDPQVKHLNIVQEIPSADGETQIKQICHPVWYSDSQLPIRIPPPTLGQHTEDILKELLNVESLSEINDLRRKRII